MGDIAQLGIGVVVIVLVLDKVFTFIKAFKNINGNGGHHYDELKEALKDIKDTNKELTRAVEEQTRVITESAIYTKLVLKKLDDQSR